MNKALLRVLCSVLIGSSPFVAHATEMTNASNNAVSSEKNTAVKFTSDIQTLETGLSAVEFDGDYHFDQFIAQGGASSDKGVLTFLMRHLLADNNPSQRLEGLQFGQPIFGCSTISVAKPDGGYLFGRNFDWRNSDVLIVKADPKNGYQSISTVNLDFIRQAASIFSSIIPERILTNAALYAPLDGMNEKGLTISVNMIEDRDGIDQETEKPDITTTTAIRLLLDKAANVDEAIALLKSYDFHASFGYMVHLAIADAQGKSVVIEYINNQMKIVNTPVVTNFYLAEGEKQGIGSAQSHQRYDILKKRLAQMKTMDIKDVRDALSDVSKRHFEEFLSTEWSVIYDQSRLTARYYHRENFKDSYSFRLLNK